MTEACVKNLANEKRTYLSNSKNTRNVHLAHCWFHAQKFHVVLDTSTKISGRQNKPIDCSETKKAFFLQCTVPQGAHAWVAESKHQSLSKMEVGMNPAKLYLQHNNDVLRNRFKENPRALTVDSKSTLILTSSEVNLVVPGLQVIIHHEVAQPMKDKNKGLSRCLIIHS